MRKSEQVSLDEVRTFIARLGRTPRDRLQWALDFSARDLATLSVGDWTNLQRELVAFCELLLTPEPRARETARATKTARTASPEVYFAADSATPPIRLLPTKEEIVGEQRLWRSMISVLFTPGGRMIYRLKPEIQFEVVRLDSAGRMKLHLSAHGEDAGRLQLANLLTSHVLLLRECAEPACGRRFIGKRRGQEFCSRTCQNRAAVRAHRERAAARRTKTEATTRRSRVVKRKRKGG